MSREDYGRYGISRSAGRVDRSEYFRDVGPAGDYEYGMGRPNWGSARSDYGEHAYGGRLDERGLGREGRRGGGRGVLDRAGDEVRSWFGDEEAERRRRMDERGDRRHYPGGRRGESQYEGVSPRRERWEDVLARDVMTRDVALVQADDTAEYAARLMLDCDCGALPVVDRDGRIRGMVTDRDIAVRLVARGADVRRARVGDCMTDEAFACHESDTAEDCLRGMSRHQVRRMPIVDDRGRVVGIVSQGDLARHAAEHAGAGERREVADVLCAVSEPSDRPYR
jgi:CBS domain-containing protein